MVTLASKHGFEWRPTNINNSHISNVDIIQRDLHQLMPWIADLLKVPTRHWSQIIPDTAQLLNTLPTTAHGMVPETVHFGSKFELFMPGEKVTKLTRDSWSVVRNRLIQNVRKGVELIETKFFENEFFQSDEKVFVLISEHSNVTARVIADFGHYLWVQKEDGRDTFSKSVIHKSRVLRIENH